MQSLQAQFLLGREGSTICANISIPAKLTNDSRIRFKLSRSATMLDTSSQNSAALDVANIKMMLLSLENMLMVRRKL